MGTYSTRRDILCRARSGNESGTDLAAALGVIIIRTVALLALAGLVVAALL